MVHKVRGKPSLLVNLGENRSKLEVHAKQLCIHLLKDWSDVKEDDIQVCHSKAARFRCDSKSCHILFREAQGRSLQPAESQCKVKLCLTFLLLGQISEISGGITNLLWKLIPAEGTGLAPVVVRVFGQQTDKLIDREAEQQALLQLNKAGFGAQVCMCLASQTTLAPALCSRSGSFSTRS